MSNPCAVDVAAWRAQARASVRGGHPAAVAMMLADLAEPLTAAHWSAIHLDLDEGAVRRLVNGAHVHPAGLHRILVELVRDGLLARIRSLADGEWGTYALALPRGSASTPAPPVERPACQPAPGRRLSRRRITRSPSVQANAERRQRGHPRRRRT